MFDKMSSYVILFSLAFFAGVMAEVPGAHEGHMGATVDPFSELLHMYNISEAEFDHSLMNRVVTSFVEKLHCGSEDDGTTSNCGGAFCLTIPGDLFGANSTTPISEEHFEQVSVSMVVLAKVASSTCGLSITLNTSLLTSHQTDLTNLLGYNVPDGGVLSKLQDVLESLSLEASAHGDSEHEGHGEEHEHENEHEDEHAGEHEEGHGNEHEHMDEHENEIAGVQEDDHEDEHMGEHVGEPENGHENEHEDEHFGEHIETIEDECLGADILFDVLGHDVYNPEDLPEIGHLASAVVLYILKGAHVSRECRVLPREGFFTRDVFERFHDGNGVINKAEFDEMLEVLEIGDAHSESKEAEDDGHDHRRRRRSTQTTSAGLLSHAEWNTTCYTGDQLWALYGVPDSGLTADIFVDLCPALIQQISSKSCVAPPEMESDNYKAPSTAEKYGYGTIATLIVCMCSAVGVLFVRCCSDRVFQTVIELFLGLAVGTLVMDSLLHLIPKALGIHSEHAHAHEAGGPIEVEEFVWYALAISGGLYAFYLLEKIFSMCSGSHSHSHYSMETKDIAIVKNGTTSEGIENGGFENGHSASSKKTTFTDLDEIRGQGSQATKKKGIQPVVLMVLVGDALHNFADGMAIGASFSTDLLLGVSTTIAVFFHELPHELGDTAILLNSGMSLTRTLLFNFLSSLTAMVGLYVGVAVSADENVQRWIVAFTSGMFIYIALVDMLPQLIHFRGRTVGMCLLNNVGILLGALCMILLSVFEAQIRV